MREGEGGRERKREGGREGRESGRKEGREGEKEGGREGGKEGHSVHAHTPTSHANMHTLKDIDWRVRFTWYALLQLTHSEMGKSVMTEQ